MVEIDTKGYVYRQIVGMLIISHRSDHEYIDH